MQDSNNQNSGASLGVDGTNNDAPNAMDGFAALAQASAARLADEDVARDSGGNGDGTIRHLAALGPRNTGPSVKSSYSTSSSSKDGNGSSSSSSVCSGSSPTPPLGTSSVLPASRDVLTTAALCAAVSTGASNGNAPLAVVQESVEQDLTNQAEALIGLATISSVAPPVPETSPGLDPRASTNQASTFASQAAGEAATYHPSHISITTDPNFERCVHRASKRPLPSNSPAMPPGPSLDQSLDPSSPPVVRLRPLSSMEGGLVHSDLAAQNLPSPLFAPRQKLRRGKWTPEEEAYVARVIQDFNSGFLRAPAGTTLRTYLSEKLHCDPMRITKKFTGDACIGKRVFHPAVRCAANGFEIDKAQAELDNLESKWRKRLESQQKEATRRANRHSNSSGVPSQPAGEVRVQHGSANERTLQQSSSLPQPAPDGFRLPPAPPQDQHVAVTQTATWLDKATSLLSNPNASSFDVAAQMQQMEELIHEGPQIRQSLPALLHKSSIASPDHVSSAENTVSLPPVGLDGQGHSQGWQGSAEQGQEANGLSSMQSSFPMSEPNAVSHLNATSESASQPALDHTSQQHHVVTQTANWLDQANMLLETQQQQQHPSDVKRQLQQMEHLIHQGPHIQQSSADLPQMMMQRQQQQQQQQPKERRGPTPNLVSQTSDAEALVGFINSIRQESESAKQQQQGEHDQAQIPS